MSTGAAAGAGVGATVGFLLIVAAVVFAFRLGRRRAIAKTTPGGSREPAEVEGSGPALAAWGGAGGPHELSSKNNPSELPAREIGELDGGHHR